MELHIGVRGVDLCTCCSVHAVVEFVPTSDVRNEVRLVDKEGLGRLHTDPAYFHVNVIESGKVTTSTMNAFLVNSKIATSKHQKKFDLDSK